MRRTTPALALTAVLALAALTACSGGDDLDQTDPDIKPATLTVLAAASLTEAFTEIGDQFEAEHPGVTVEFSFAASSDLAAQITEGAPADVFASADQKNMDKVVDADAAVDPQVFALNQLVIAVPAGNPDGVTGLADLAGLDFAACAAEVPCGAAAETAVAASGADLTPVTYEADVKSTLQKLTLGEVDAALVYRTDAIAADDEVDAVEFPESAEAVNAYPITALADARESHLAAEFTEYVLGDDAWTVLEAAGFQRP
ncbi:MAG: molybdate ABC transporter substrate-binding protein [Glycomyces artemisiae]|uniref:Molybdate-binding protein ModA n=1 Tax=Glycomyces artemisiae TaxID=1076443 RepID=A0A850C2X1_9ACTN|nr:molybdate ABC transporter substrate-binding protein [Glycomyces artemisiae]